MNRLQNWRRQTRRLCLCAVLCALGVILLASAYLLDVLELTAAVAASVLIGMLTAEFGWRYALPSFFATGILGWILMPTNAAVYCYLLLFGYYPMLKSRIESKLPRVLAWVVKLAAFNATYSVYVFLLPILLTQKTETAAWYLVAMYLGGNLLMFLYDFALSRLRVLYWRRLRDSLRISKWIS